MLGSSPADLAALIESIDGIVWEAEADTLRFTYVSPRAERLLGYPARQWLEDPGFWRNHLYPDDREAAVGYCVEQTRLHRPHDFEYRMVAADGRVVWLRDIVSIATGPDGSPRVRGVMVDITAHKETELRLARLNRTSRAIWDAVVDAIITMDPAGRLTDLNPAAERMFGHTRHEAVGRLVADLIVPAEHREAHARGLARYVAEGTSAMLGRRLEFDALHAAGHRFPIELTVVAVGGGADLQFVATLRDVTARREAEAALRQMQKLDSIGRLAAGIAHDFNNILTVQQGYLAELLADTSLPGDVAEPLQQVANAADRASALTRQLLLFSRRQVMQRRPLSLNDAVTSLGRMLGRLLGAHIALELRLDADRPVVHADPGMVEQVIMNLAVNARDAMPGGGTLTIETATRHIVEASAPGNPEARPGRFGCLTVRDTGTGIADAMLAHLFEPFSTTKDVGEGTGLGLATVHGIVKQHDGWVEVTTTQGAGTTFHVLLPAAAQAEAEAPPTSPLPPGRGRGETILVVEDEAALRRVVTVVLERQGYRVLEAANGAEALDLWAEHGAAIDLLVTDLVMPGGWTGWQVAEHLRRDRPDLCVVLTSGYSTDLAGRELAATPETTFLQKPYVPRQLTEAVRVLLDGSGATPRVPPH